MTTDNRDDPYRRYLDDPAFHSLVRTLEAFFTQHEGQFTIGEYRHAFTLALERREMLRVRPILVGDVSP